MEVQGELMWPCPAQVQNFTMALPIYMSNAEGEGQEFVSLNGF